jgi:serine/threonine protein kinase/formylglycine-generating enzyme required for sulfatase activity
MSDKDLDTDGQSLNIDQLIADFKTRTDAGEPFPFEKFIAEHPEHTDELTRYFKQWKELEAPSHPDKAGADKSSTGTSKPGKLSEEDATAHTVVQVSGDSESSLTQAYDQSEDESATSVEISDSFGRYAIQKVLGQGAMGAVYLAKDTQLDRDVALKIPKFGDGNGVDDEELLARFYREARAAATLRSPNICPVYDVGEIDGQHYITMAFIDGRPLKDYTKSKKTHSEKQIITTIRKLALGLAEAHEIGVIHRDLKPANIMVDLKGEPVVMDFGLARRSSSDDVQVTQSGAIIGTPAYMAPEQVAGDQSAIDHQADIYALGIIMYELITGEMPFKGNLMALLQQIALNNPTKPSELRPDIDPRLEAICLKMMAGDQAQRYQSMTDVATDLQEVLRNPDERHRQAQAGKKGPKPNSLPTAKEESNPALISIDRSKSSADRMRTKQRKKSSSASKSTAASKSNSSSPPKKLLIAGGIGGLLLLLLLVVVSFILPGNQDEQTAASDSVINPSENGEKTATPFFAKSNSDGSKTPGTSGTKGKYALQFDGTSVVIIPNTNWSERDELTYEVFVQDSDVNNHESGMKYVLNHNYTCALLRWIDGWGFMANLGGENGEKMVRVSSSKQLPAPEDWVHLAGVIKNRTIQLFVNGEPMELKQLPRNVNAKSGKSVQLGPKFAGKIRGVKISKTARFDKRFDPPQQFANDDDTLALYHFNEGSGEVLKDSSGNGYDGKIEGAKWVLLDQTVASQNSERNDALYFDGRTSRVEVPDFQLSGSPPLTLEGWLTPSPKSTSNAILFYGGKLDSLTIQVGGIRRWEFGGRQASTDRRVEVFGPRIKEWETRTHVAGQWDGKSLELFIDGKPVKRNDNTGSFSPQGILEIGGHNGSRFKGKIDEIRISNTLRYKTEFTPPDELTNDQHTLALYHFNEGSGDILKDSSGNGHDGKIVGAKWVKVDGVSNNDAQVGPNLLAQVNLDEDVLQGTWKRGRGSVLHPERVQGKMSLLQLPKFELPDEYDVEIILERSADGPGGANLVFSWFGYQAALAMDGLPKGAWFIEMINGKTAQESPAYVEGIPLKTGVHHRVRFAVRKDSLEVYLDDKLAIHWAGDPKLLSPFPWLKTPDVDRLSLGANSVMTFHSVMVRDVATDRYLGTERSATSPPLPAVAPFDAVQGKAHQKAWAEYLGLPVEKEVELPGGEKMAFVLIPPGEFMMGAGEEEKARFLKEAIASDDKYSIQRIPFEGPQHRVRITRPFYLGAYEVTQSQWEAVVGTNPSKYTGNPTHPVEMVNWDDTQLFFAKLNKDSTDQSLKFALPTEAQWEYACRAGTATLWYCGDNDEDLPQFAWYLQNARNTTYPVGQLKPNAFGLYDMHGNVFEWCNDWFQKDSSGYYENSPVDDPIGPALGTRRINRGGSFPVTASRQRSAHRNFEGQDRGFSVIGFRAAMMIDIAKLVKADNDSSQTIDLLADLVPTILNSRNMTWQMQDGILIGNSTASRKRKDWAGAKFPQEISGDFDIELELKQSGFAPLQLDLPLGDKQAIRLHLGGLGCALMVIDGKEDRDAAPQHSNKDVKLKRDVWQRLTAKVRHQGENVSIDVDLDGERIGLFSGLRSRITFPKWVKPDPVHVKFAGTGHNELQLEFRRAVVHIDPPAAIEIEKTKPK